MQLYAGGSYAFITLREHDGCALAATATLLRPLRVGGCQLRMLRPRECEHLGAVGAMAVPPEALAAPVTLGEAAAVVCAVCESDGPAAAPHASLETKVYWAMRQAPGVIDSGAWPDR